MATIKDLDFQSIVDESNDEAIERLRQIRLSRRVVKKSAPTKTQKSTESKALKAAINNLDQASIAKLLSELKG